MVNEFPSVTGARRSIYYIQKNPPLDLSQLNQKTSKKFDVINAILTVQLDMASSLFLSDLVFIPKAPTHFHMLH